VGRIRTLVFRHGGRDLALAVDSPEQTGTVRTSALPVVHLDYWVRGEPTFAMFSNSVTGSFLRERVLESLFRNACSFSGARIE